MTDPNVISVLENDKSHVETIELFDENNLYKIVKKDSEKQTDKHSNNGSDYSQSRLRTSSSICLTQDSCDSNEDRPRSKTKTISSKFISRLSMDNLNEERISKFKSGLATFALKVMNDVNCQREHFEKRKQNKMLKQYLIKRNKSKSYIKRSRKILLACGTISVDETLKMIDDILLLSQRKMVCEQKIMEDEMEVFIKKNLNEMHNSIEELKESFVSEAKFMEETGFTHVAERLYEDMEIEIDDMKRQYDEVRFEGIEKIKSKYFKLFK